MADDFDFDAALAAAVASQAETPAAPEDPPAEDPAAENENEETPYADPPEGEEPAGEEGEEEDAPAGEEQPRDDQGRFLPKFNDPDVSAYVERFGGDLNAALKSAVEAQSLIGRQGNELGELRKMVQGIQERMDAPPPQQQILPPGAFEDEIEEDPGAVAQWAITNGHEALFDQAMAAWYEVAPREATRFELAIERQMIRDELAQVAAPVQMTAAQQAEALAVRELQAQYPDFGSVLESATPEELSGLNQAVVRQLRDTDPKAAHEMVYRWVKSGRPAPQAAPAEPVTAERVAETRAAKQAAAVVSGTSRPASGDKSTMDKLKESMLSPDPHSVSHGLKGF